MKSLVEPTIVLLTLSVLSVVTHQAVSDISDELYEQPSYPQPYFNRRMQDLLESKRSISAIKRLVTDLENNFGKRMLCDINGGLSASCNNKDVMDALDHHRFLKSSFAPGRRRKRLTSKAVNKQ